MRRWSGSLVAMVLGCIVASLCASERSPGTGNAERGRDLVKGRPALNPALWSRRVLDEAWKQWGLTEKPADYERLFRDRYGLQPALYENRGLPMGLHEAQGLLGKGVVNDCLMCHAGTVAGRTYIGLGNASLDLQTLFEEMAAASGTKFDLPFQFSYARGTIDPITPVAFLMQFRDADLNIRERTPVDFFQDICSDPPAWWQLKRKKTRDWTGGIDARSARVDMVNLLTPLNTGEYVKKQATAFEDIHAFVLTVQAPRYPFPIDDKLASQGKKLFEETCARCHGAYGANPTYPNKIVHLDEIGTDPALAEATSERNMNHFNSSWLAQETGPDGRTSKVVDTRGYQAPPLDGVWATAPYLHNASVPTLYHVLNSKARPKIFTRSYQTGEEDYDPIRVGWKITVLDRPADPRLPARERRKIYDTTRRGQGNAGHTFGDEFTEEQRMAVIEYLKTL